MEDKTLIEQLPYVDGVVECGDQRQIKWLKSNELLNGADEPNSNKGTANRVPLMLYKNIIFIAEEMDKNGVVVKDHTKQIEKLFEEFEYFGGEEFAEKIEKIIKEQELLGETNLEILIQLEEFEESMDQHDEVIGMDSDFDDREGSLIKNIGYIASLIGNKEGKDFYGNEVEDNPSSGVYDTMTTVIKTVNGLRTQVTEFDNTLNNVELQVSGQVLEIEGIKAVVGDKAKVIINDIEVELVHDDAIEQLFERVNDLGGIVKDYNEKVNEHDSMIDLINENIGVVTEEIGSCNKKNEEQDRNIEDILLRIDNMDFYSKEESNTTFVKNEKIEKLEEVWRSDKGIFRSIELRGGTKSINTVDFENAVTELKLFGVDRNKIYQLSYFLNDAKLGSYQGFSFRIKVYEDLDHFGSGLEESYSLITPQQLIKNFNVGGVGTYRINSESIAGAYVEITFNHSFITRKLGLPYNMDIHGPVAGRNTYISEQCIHDLKDGNGEEHNTKNKYDVDGVMAIGASLISPVNGWFERGTIMAGANPINKAVSGKMPNYHADLIFRDKFCTDKEFEMADILVIQYASSKDISDENELFEFSEDYTRSFDINDESNQFSVYTQAQIIDYIIKYWRERCVEQEHNINSKWFGHKFGKPIRIIFVTHWHDSREYYNIPVRELCEKWGGVLCQLDTKIGFSKRVLMPDGTQPSLLYSMDKQTIDGIEYGWHPSRGEDGGYIQDRMAKIFFVTLMENGFKGKNHG